MCEELVLCTPDDNITYRSQVLVAGGNCRRSAAISGGNRNSRPAVCEQMGHSVLVELSRRVCTFHVLPADCAICTLLESNDNETTLVLSTSTKSDEDCVCGQRANTTIKKSSPPPSPSSYAAVHLSWAGVWPPLSNFWGFSARSRSGHVLGHVLRRCRGRQRPVSGLTRQGNKQYKICHMTVYCLYLAKIQETNCPAASVQNDHNDLHFRLSLRLQRQI